LLLSFSMASRNYSCCPACMSIRLETQYWLGVVNVQYAYAGVDLAIGHRSNQIEELKCCGTMCHTKQISVCDCKVLLFWRCLPSFL
jgi:hypothetical protein